MSTTLVGDPRLSSPSGLTQLFSKTKDFTGEIEVEDFELLVKTSIEGGWEFYRNTYLISALDLPQQHKLELQLKKLLGEYKKSGDTVEWSLPL